MMQFMGSQRVRRASLVSQMVKRLPAMRETWVQSLGLEDPLEVDMATHSSTLAWKIPWMARLDRNLGVAFQTHLGVRPRLEGKQRK